MNKRNERIVIGSGHLYVPEQFKTNDFFKALNGYSSIGFTLQAALSALNPKLMQEVEADLTKKLASSSLRTSIDNKLFSADIDLGKSDHQVSALKDYMDFDIREDKSFKLRVSRDRVLAMNPDFNKQLLNIVSILFLKDSFTKFH